MVVNLINFAGPLWSLARGERVGSFSMRRAKASDPWGSLSMERRPAWRGVCFIWKEGMSILPAWVWVCDCGRGLKAREGTGLILLLGAGRMKASVMVMAAATTTSSRAALLLLCKAMMMLVLSLLFACVCGCVSVCRSVVAAHCLKD
jgi:hypothetical protein